MGGETPDGHPQPWRDDARRRWCWWAKGSTSLPRGERVQERVRLQHGRGAAKSTSATPTRPRRAVKAIEQLVTGTDGLSAAEPRAQSEDAAFRWPARSVQASRTRLPTYLPRRGWCSLVAPRWSSPLSTLRPPSGSRSWLRRRAASGVAIAPAGCSNALPLMAFQDALDTLAAELVGSSTSFHAPLSGGRRW